MMPDDVRSILNSHAAELAVIRLLLNAALRQLPDQRVLLANFNEMAEDNEVRAMFSDMPESFFQAFRQHRSVWEGLLADAIEQTAPDAPEGS